MNNERGDVGQKKQNGRNGKSLSFSLIKKEPSFSFFSVSSKEGKQTTLGWPKNKTHRLLSRSHSFLLKEPPSTTNERRRFQIEWQIRIKALLPRMLLLPSEIRERVRFFTPHHIGLLPIFERERGREINKIISFVSFSLCLLLSAPPPQPLSSISRRRRAIIAKEQI